MTERLEGAPIVAATERAVRDRVAVGRESGLAAPNLVSVHLGEPTPFSFYLSRQARGAVAVGVGFRAQSLGTDRTAAGLDRTLEALDRDPGVDAVLVEHPLPPPLDFPRAVTRLRPEKDVDGVGPLNLGFLAQQRPVQVPAVAAAALAVARHYELPLARQTTAVIGRSSTVGIPLALALLLKSPGTDATVLVAHSRTPDLRSALASSRVIFSCAGVPGLLTRDVVPKESAIIDVGLASVPDAGRPSGARLVGDADPVSLDGWASALTPVPGGVGPVTVAKLMENTVHGWELRHRTGP